jgi:hypothetical protein
MPHTILPSTLLYFPHLMCILDTRYYIFFIDTHWNTPLALSEAWGGALDATGRLLIVMVGRLVVEVGRRRCCLKDCWECLLFTWARSMGRAVQWSPMKPESWPGCFPLKSSPTCSCRWLHCDLQNVPFKHPNCTARTQRANWPESSDWSVFPYISVDVLRRTQV